MKKLLALAAAALLTAPMAANAVVYEFNALLNGASELPTPTMSNGSGLATLFYDDKNTASTADDTYDFSESVFALSGTATGYHIHSSATGLAVAPVVVNLASVPFVSLNSGGTLLIGGNDVAPPYATFLTELRAGYAYVNVHTAAFPGGEIRGQLLQVAVVPEPASYAMLGAGLLSVMLWRRRAPSAG